MSHHSVPAMDTEIEDHQYQILRFWMYITSEKSIYILDFTRCLSWENCWHIHTDWACILPLLSQCVVFFYRDIPYLDWLQQDIGYWSTDVCAPSVAEGEDILENYLNNFRKLAGLFVTVSPNSIYSKFQAQSGLLWNTWAWLSVFMFLLMSPCFKLREESQRYIKPWT